MIECYEKDSDKTVLINENTIVYCYLVTKDRYGNAIDNIKISFINEKLLEFGRGKETYEKIRRGGGY